MIIAGNHTKEAFYEANGFSRQFIYKKSKSISKSEQLEQGIIKLVKNVREKHRKMGSRVMFHHLKIANIGVNKFEQIVSKNGLTIVKKKKRIVTTNGLYEQHDKNLINGLVLTDINQVIAGDITYYSTKNKQYYIFTLKDMYSKRIIGLYASETMMAINALITLKQATKLRGAAIKNCIHHTDAGSQYKSNAYKKALATKSIKMSIAENCLQNGMAEQLNGVLKNDYLFKEVKNLKELNNYLREIKALINSERPVKELGYKTPIAFEESLNHIRIRKQIKLYDFNKNSEGTYERHNNKKSLLV